MSDIKRDLFVCDCASSEHQFIVTYSKYGDDDDDVDIYIHVHLTKKPFWKRFKHAIAYLFGYQCKFGAFDEVMLNPEECKRLSDIMLERSKANEPKN
jgi:hypothetical protein